MGKRIDEDQRDNYYKNLLNHPILSRTDERETLELVAKGDVKAREKMVLHNLRLVFSIAAKSKSSLPLDDCFSAGCEAIYRALDKFDLSKNMRFSTYATPWIKQFIRRASFDIDALYLPENVRSLIKLKKEFYTRYSQHYGDNPSNDLIKEHLHKNIWQITTDEILEFAMTYNGSYSFNLLEPYLALSSADNTENTAMNNTMASEIHNILEKILTPREHYILMYRYGMNKKENPDDDAGRDEGVVTHKAIGEKLGLTRQRVQQIETAILRKLRSHFGELYDNSDSNGV